MKFAFLVSGPALSEGQIDAFRRSVEDLAQHYGMDKFAMPFQVERIPDNLAFPLGGESPPVSPFCPQCGSVVRFEYGSAESPCADSWHSSERSKSARGSLNWFSRFQLPRPLDVGVGLLLAFVAGYAFAMLVKTLGS